MIAYIQGNLVSISTTQLIIEAGNIGYEVHISLHTYEKLKHSVRCKVFTYLHFTQDVQMLYGFENIEEKQCFLQLLNVNGIGPRVAITILSSLTPVELYQAIMMGEATRLQAIKGIGHKAAQRIILELKDKVGQLDDILSTQQAGSQDVYQEALAALLKLGIPKAHAEKTLAAVRKSAPPDITVEALIKLALKS